MPIHMNCRLQSKPPIFIDCVSNDLYWNVESSMMSITGTATIVRFPATRLNSGCSQPTAIQQQCILCLKKMCQLWASCSFYKHGLILVILHKQHQDTFKNDMHIQLSLSPLFQQWFSITSLSWPKITTITYQHWISNSCRLSATVCDCQQQKIDCSLKVSDRCLWLSMIQHIVNHWFYITVNNLCK